MLPPFIKKADIFAIAFVVVLNTIIFRKIFAPVKKNDKR